MKRLIAGVFVTALASPAFAALPTPDKDDGAIKLPPGFRALVVADDLGPLRFMTVAPNGDVYVKMQTVGIIALRDADGDGRAETRAAFGTGGGTGIGLRDGWLYSSTTTAVSRYKMTAGELVPKGEPELVVSGLPDENQHNSKSFAFDEAGLLYVEVGSPSNSYGSPDRAKGAKGQDPTEFLKTHGGFWRFDPNKPNQTQADGYHFSTGHRHVLAVARNPVSKAFFVVMMGRDQLNTVAPEYYNDDDNAEAPAEEMHVLREGGSFGWPFTYFDPRKKARMVAPEYGGDNQKRAEAGKYPDPLVAFPAHWAPLQMAFYGGDQFPAKYRGGAFVAFHGSWNRAPRPQRGYNVAFVPFGASGMPSGGYEVFADGFAGKDEFTLDARRTLPAVRPRRRPGRLALRRGLGEGPHLADRLHGRGCKDSRTRRLGGRGGGRCAGSGGHHGSGREPGAGGFDLPRALRGLPHGRRQRRPEHAAGAAGQRVPRERRDDAHPPGAVRPRQGAAGEPSALREPDAGAPGNAERPAGRRRPQLRAADVREGAAFDQGDGRRDGACQALDAAARGRRSRKARGQLAERSSRYATTSEAEYELLPSGRKRARPATSSPAVTRTGSGPCRRHWPRPTVATSPLQTHLRPCVSSSRPPLRT